MSEIDGLSELIGKPGESVVVDAADFKAMWAYRQTLKAEHPKIGRSRGRYWCECLEANSRSRPRH